jgi:biotin carboxyl carrier protein
MTRQFKVTVNGREYDVAVLEVTADTAAAPSMSTLPVAEAPAVAGQVKAVVPVAQASPTSAAGDEVAQMGGVVVQVDVKAGQVVAQGDRLIVLEAMKMKTHLLASKAGQVTRVLVAPGDAVEGGQPLVTIQ